MTGDIILFAVLPYVAVVIGVGVGVLRYRRDRFSYSTLSSELLDKRSLFWGSVPWHYAITVILLAHIVAFLIPGVWSQIISSASAMYSLEVVGFAIALLSIFGICLLIWRRMTRPRVFAVSSVMDWVLLAALLVQVALGLWVSLYYRWGSNWYVHTSVPWLQSLVMLNPQTHFVTALPWAVKLHLLNGFVLIALFPFTRLVHLVALPFWYLWRPYQVVVRNRARPTP